ncbi:hypothetical protein K6119_12605 [Paracrocinitomix mangrovi]|uniref:hypothetical protein n=1 Tax=Paracrocinitomix mangrovi TaxID=2862509 RepID=UPI001C8D69C7|nr:hypothetical protein [Paracrocinitomix mangrovi]UKN00571.1 hypothetical protein K6119_12605 [Paracrocinitomix mangrovi]
MERKLLTLSAAVFLLLAACGSETEQSNDQSTSENESVELDDTTSLTVTTNDDGTEVYEFKTGKITLKSSEDAACGKDYFGGPWNDGKNLMEEDTSVYVIGDSMIFKLYNGSELVLKATQFTDDSDYDQVFSYGYVANLDQVDYWAVNAYGYEYHETYIISKINGRITKSVGHPFASPSKNYLIMINSDMEAGFTENHLTVFDIESDGLHEKGKLSLDTASWSPRGIEWISDSRFKVLQARFNEETYGLDMSCAEGSIE